MTPRLTVPGSTASGPIARRVALVRQKAPTEAHGPHGKFLFGELSAPFEPLARLFREPLVLPRTAHPRVVMLLPGFGTHPLRMRYMARRLERAGHTVKRWGLGFNLGPTEDTFALLEERVRQIHEPGLHGADRAGGGLRR